MKIRKDAIEEIYNRVEPNTFITLTGKQVIIGASGIVVPASRDAYARAMKGFWRQVSIRVYGKRNWRKRRLPPPNVTVVEQSTGGMWHIHCCARRPVHVTIERFRQIVEECWYKSVWSKQIVQVDEYRGYGVHYILKTGQDALLVDSCNFDEGATGCPLAK